MYLKYVGAFLLLDASENKENVIYFLRDIERICFSVNFNRN